jgi:hypothetical protein
VSWPVGTIVVCVNTAKNPSRHPEQEYASGGLTKLREGAYYTIEEWCDGAEFADGVAGVRLVEVPRPPGHYYDWWRFRRAESSHSESATARKAEPVGK